MLQKFRICISLALVLVFAFTFAAAATNESVIDESPLLTEELIVYITDDDGNSYKEVNDPTCGVHYEPITEDDLLAYLNESVPDDSSVLLEENTFTVVGQDDQTYAISAVCPSNQHSWGPWQPNSAFCFRNCTKCGEPNRWQGHYISSYTPYSASQHKVTCSQCGWLHGYVAHSWVAIPPNIQICSVCNYS